MSFLTALAIGLATASAFHPALGLSRDRRLLVLAALWPIVLSTPLLIDPDLRFTRFLSGALAAVLSIKLYDLHLGALLGRRPKFRDVFPFLINLTCMVERKVGDEPRPPWRSNLRRLAAMLLASIPGAILFAGCYRVEWRSAPFFVEHVAKSLAFFLLLVPATHAAAATWRLLGNPAREPMDNPFASITPADFWRRYNRIAGQFFLEDLFKPLNGRRRPIRGTMATFAVSGLLHEYAFDIAAGRFQGYQTAFFLIQGVAVVLTMKVRPRGWWRAVGLAATLAFALASTLLFFASMDELTPFYQRR